MKSPIDDVHDSYGEICFHFKGADALLLDQWKYEFWKFHNAIESIYKKLMKTQAIFAKQFQTTPQPPNHVASNTHYQQQPHSHHQKATRRDHGPPQPIHPSNQSVAAGAKRPTNP